MAALEVEVKPDQPKLGNIIFVLVSTDTNSSIPIVNTAQGSYPVFATSENGYRYRALLPTTPLDKPGELVVTVTVNGETENVTVWLSDRSFPTQRISLSGGGEGATELELSRVAEFKKLVTAEKLWNGPFLRPNQGRVSTVFGIRRYYNGVFATEYYHRGVDYGGGSGSPVTAPAAGRVRLVGTESEGFRVHGNTVGIDHGQGVLSIFLHLSLIDVKEGDLVVPGQRIGAVGSTGASTGPRSLAIWHH